MNIKKWLILDAIFTTLVVIGILIYIDQNRIENGKKNVDNKVNLPKAEPVLSHPQIQPNIKLPIQNNPNQNKPGEPVEILNHGEIISNVAGFERPVENNFLVSADSSVFAKMNNRLGFDLWQKIFENNTEKNICLSPYSISLALAMAYNGAQNETKKAMTNIFDPQGINLDNLNSASLSLQNKILRKNSGVQLEIANSLWYRQGFNPLPKFLEYLVKYYQTQAQSLDFSSPKAPIIINAWVKKSTHDKIQEIVQNIDENTMMYLINAVYFKGFWANKFDPSATSEGEFKSLKNTFQKCSMMMQSQKMPYLANEKFQAVGLPYQDNEIYLYIFLPNQENSLENFIKDDWNFAKFENYLSEFQAQQVILSMPKFKIEFKSSLKTCLEKMGMGIAFSNFADFSNISPKSDFGNLFIKDIQHKTYLEVNEEGSEAAAVTSIEFGVESISETFELTINRPFVFAIYDQINQTLLFMGQIVEMK